ncbi:MAG: SAM-dependent methyltransferase [Halieaceae bacterium]|jgi:SAM-dependent methyltransferase
MKNDANMQSIEISRALESWYRGHGGTELFDKLRDRLQPLLDRAFGYHIMQMGPLGAQSLIAGSPINHRIYVSEVSGNGSTLRCHGSDLPLESDSVDMLVAFHALEFDEHPHGVVREMQRVLRPHGHLIIIGFNPHGLLGISQYLRRMRRSSLWHQHRPVSTRRLSDWLRLVDCELESIHHLYPIPLIGRGRLRRAIGRIDDWASRHGLPGGSVYIAHAMKQIGGMRRVPPLRERARRRLVGLAAVGSAASTPRQPRDDSGSDVAA